MYIYIFIKHSPSMILNLKGGLNESLHNALIENNITIIIITKIIFTYILINYHNYRI